MPNDKNTEAAGLRARKRIETAKRIRQAGIRLFMEKGYDATTLDDIAAAADISRRTVFHYFGSKEEILLSMRASADDDIAPAMRKLPPGGRPVDAARAALAAVCAQYRTEELRVVDQLMRASETVQARKQTFYIAREKALLAALRERWPEPEQEAGLQIVAMVSVAAFRHALDMFTLEGGERALVNFLHEAFDLLEGQFRLP